MSNYSYHHHFLFDRIIAAVILDRVVSLVDMNSGVHFSGHDGLLNAYELCGKYVIMTGRVLLAGLKRRPVLYLSVYHILTASKSLFMDLTLILSNIYKDPAKNDKRRN